MPSSQLLARPGPARCRDREPPRTTRGDQPWVGLLAPARAGCRAGERRAGRATGALLWWHK